MVLIFYPVLYLTLVLLQVLDYHSTMKAMRAGHDEKNPLMKRWHGHALKITCLVIIPVFSTFISTTIELMVIIVALLIIDIFYTCIVINNYSLVIRREIKTASA